MNLKKAVECVRKNKKFLITSHVNLEGDALGSELAFYRLLKKLGKNATIVNEDNLPYGYDFLPGKENIKKFKQGLADKIKFDCFVTLDCSDLKRSGEVYKLNAGGKPVLNIDHHISNAKFGKINWVEPQSSCCCEMIYKLYKKLGVTIDKDAAVCLYAGIVADTGSFRYSNTSSSTHRIASELLKYNINIPQVYKDIYENIPFADMKLLAGILPDIRQEAGGRIIWCKLRRNMLKSRKLSFDLTEQILSFCRAVKGVEVAVLFKENLGVKDEIRVNFRSQGRVDVNKVAAFFGGGGHKTASGATIRGNIDAIRKNVLAKIKEVLK